MAVVMNGSTIQTYDHIYMNGTRIYNVVFNGSTMWSWSAVQGQWWWCDTCVNRITTEVPSAMTPVIQASKGTYCSLTYIGDSKWRFNRNATRNFEVKIGNSSWRTITPDSELLFRNAGDPYIFINGSVVYGGQDKPFLYMRST